MTTSPTEEDIVARADFSLASLLDEAYRRFDAWREENDPLHELPIEIAAEQYARARSSLSDGVK